MPRLARPILVLTLAGLTAPAHAIAPPARDAAASALAFTEAATATERALAREGVLANLSAALPGLSFNGTPDPELQRQVEQLWKNACGECAAILREEQTAVSETNRKLLKSWEEMRTDRWNKEVEKYDLQIELDTVSQTAYVLAAESRWVWLVGLIAIVLLATAAWHDRRHELRRVFNGGRARSLGLARFLRRGAIGAVIVTLLVVLFGEQVYRLALRRATGQSAPPLQRIQTQLSEAQAAQQDAEARAATRNAALESRSSQAEPIRAVVGAAMAAAEEARVRSFLLRQVADDGGAVQSLDADLEDLRQRVGDRRDSRRLFQVGSPGTELEFAL